MNITVRALEHPKRFVARKFKNYVRCGFPDEAAAWRRSFLEDENGKIPSNALMKAVQQKKAMTQPNRRMIWGQPSASDVPYKTAGISKDKWTWLGPGNIGGRSRSLIIHPTNTDTMWIGSIAGGIWKTTNGGTTWSITDDFMTNLAVTTMVMDPNNSDIIYAGTGEGFF